MIRPLVYAAFLGILVFLELSNPASAACSTFHSLPSPNSASIALNSTHSSFGAKVQQAQLQRVSIGIVCGGETPQHYGTGAASCSSAGRCALGSRGYVYGLAQTNLTGVASKLDPYGQNPLGRIVGLAIKTHARFQNGTDIAAIPGGSSQVSQAFMSCLSPGDAGWVMWRPAIRCVKGFLGGCDSHGSDVEQNGQGVEVCVPLVLNSSLQKKSHVLDGRLYFRPGKPSEVVQMKTNPAVGGPPESAPVVNTATGAGHFTPGTMAILVAVLGAALAIYRTVRWMCGHPMES